DGTCLHMVFKDLGPGAMLADARRAKPPFLFDPAREIEVYRDVLDPLRIQSARLYGWLIDEVTARYWLFIERVPGRPLNQVGDWDTWLLTARLLARTHAQLKIDSSAWPRRAIRYDACFYRLWME